MWVARKSSSAPAVSAASNHIPDDTSSSRAEDDSGLSFPVVLKIRMGSPLLLKNRYDIPTLPEIYQVFQTEVNIRGAGSADPVLHLPSLVLSQISTVTPLGACLEPSRTDENLSRSECSVCSVMPVPYMTRVRPYNRSASVCAGPWLNLIAVSPRVLSVPRR
jgi:hypothetical protein